MAEHVSHSCFLNALRQVPVEIHRREVYLQVRSIQHPFLGRAVQFDHSRSGGPCGVGKTAWSPLAEWLGE